MKKYFLLPIILVLFLGLPVLAAQARNLQQAATNTPIPPTPTPTAMHAPGNYVLHQLLCGEDCQPDGRTITAFGEMTQGEKYLYFTCWDKDTHAPCALDYTIYGDVIAHLDFINDSAGPALYGNYMVGSHYTGDDIYATQSFYCIGALSGSCTQEYKFQANAIPAWNGYENLGGAPGPGLYQLIHSMINASGGWMFDTTSHVSQQLTISLDPTTPCGSGSTSGETAGSGIIDARAENGNDNYLDMAGSYHLVTSGGPWFASPTESGRYDVAISYDLATWTPLYNAASQGNGCTSVNGSYVDYYFDIAEATHFYIRVNDKAGQFANNIGNMAYTITKETPYNPTLTMLVDADHEYQILPNPYWQLSVDSNQYIFGREEQNSFYGYFNGMASCGTGYTGVGPLSLQGIGGRFQQTFQWPGGNLYWRASVRANHSILLTAPDSYATIYILDKNGYKTYLLNNQLIPHDVWTIFHDDSNNPIYLATGTYTIFLDKGDSAWRDDTLYFDDTQLATGPMNYDQCPPDPFAPTPTGTLPTGTPTPVTYTPTLPGYPSKTPTPSGTWYTNTPTPTPHPIYIVNCDFEEQRNGWTWNDYSFPNNPGGQVGPWYAQAAGQEPGISQNFFWPGGVPYLSFFAFGEYTAQFVNVSTHQGFYMGYGYEPNWNHILENGSYMPSGQYRLELSRMPGTGETTGFDGVTLGVGNLDMGRCFQTPTPGPSPTHIQGTGTLGPTPTGTWYYFTVTPWPTWTKTIIASGTPWGTPTIWGTPEGTPTPGTGTPEGTITPCFWCQPAPPQQPPPAADAKCIRPTSPLAFAWWGEYLWCKTVAFISWGDANTNQMEHIGDDVNNREPFGTINEASNAIGTEQIVISTYVDWQNAGLPGINTAPKPDNFTNPNANGWSPYFTGHIDLTRPASHYSIACTAKITDMIGPILSQPVCFVFDIMREKDLLPWIQFFINLGCFISVVFEIRQLINT